MAGQILGGPPNGPFHKRYEVEQQLGRKSGRWTLLARDLQTDALVILKVLFMDDELQPNEVKLFNREIETLESIDHPAVPKHLGYFEIDLPQEGKALTLVQTYIEGKSLEQYLRDGITLTEAEARQVAKLTLQILDYLHTHQPPIVHRDIKPRNLLLGQVPDNRCDQVCLVDFGSVTSMMVNRKTTFTVVGTEGYIPPEQMGGRAMTISDLYSLGVTLIAALTGKQPMELQQRGRKIDFEAVITLTPEFAQWLKRLTALDLEQRWPSAQVAVDELGRITSAKNG